MRIDVLCLAVILLISGCKNSHKEDYPADIHGNDGLPHVFAEGHSDLIYSNMRHDAALSFAAHTIPSDPKELINYKTELRKKIIEKAGIDIDHKLPLNVRETGSEQMKGYTVKNLVFQVRPGIYATANLYVPDGKGPFPGVINMLGHWRKGKIDSTGPQAVGHTLAGNGYVCLTVDPWGSGERTTEHGDFEYHGAQLGASLMNIGETLLGMQVSDNMRGVDLLCSLKEVDPARIGATGASGGGNQTMWLAAVDERIRASVPVVSVGSFESYIMRSNCICELLVDGMTLTEEAGVLALANAPLLINHEKDDNPTFFPSEMLRSYENAKKAFRAAGIENYISYRLFDLPHGYMREDREAMMGWFNLHLKNEGDGSPVTGKPFEQLPENKLMVFNTGMRDADVLSTDSYCILKGTELKEMFRNKDKFNVSDKREELLKILRTDNHDNQAEAISLPESNGWERVILRSADKSLIPLLIRKPAGTKRTYTVICTSYGKDSISPQLIADYSNLGHGLALIDLKGTGEQTSTASVQMDYNGQLHTLARAELWLGRSVTGEWVSELAMLVEYLKNYRNAEKIIIDGERDAGLAALFYGAIAQTPIDVIVRSAPVSYLFDDRRNVAFYSMGIHLPGILKWGDISLAAAMAQGNITIKDPRTISGRPLTEEELGKYKEEYARMQKLAGSGSLVEFIQ